MDIVKTTIRLKSPEEVKQLLADNPQITLQLAKDAAHAVAGSLTSVIAGYINDALAKPASFNEQDRFVVYVDGEGKLRIDLPFSVKKAIMLEVNERMQQCIHLSGPDIDDEIHKEISKRLDTIDMDKIVQDAKDMLVERLTKRMIQAIQ